MGGVLKRVRSAVFRACLPLRACCLPVLSLTRTPGGRCLEFTAAFFEPVFEKCERGVYFIGLVCFLLVLAGISLVVGTFYVYMIPFLWYTVHPVMFTVYVAYGHYLLVNICFHYFMGVYTDPGAAPKIPDFDADTYEVKRGWKICSKCDAPKPPRSHHCRICGKCILKMDHHCPWMFNCVGHRNHRYFMLFVLFMLLGTCYVMLCCWTRVFVLMRVESKFVHSIINILGQRGSVERASAAYDATHMEAMLVFIIFFVCVGVSIALMILGGWHAYLITVSETTIEFYTNKRDARRAKKEGQVFVNRFHYGYVNNWKVLLGLVNRRSFIRHALLPSKHAPHHDGMDWNKEDVLCYKDKLRTIPV